MNDSTLLKFALDAGEIMLTSGAETHRVEDTMKRILSISHSSGVEALALSTLLIVSIPSDAHGPMTLTRGVRDRSVNFEKICSVNTVSRAFVSREISLEQAIKALEKISDTLTFPPVLRMVCYGIACGCFTMVLNGSWVDGLAALVFGVLMGILLINLSRRKVPYFLSYLLGGVLAGAGAMLFHNIVPTAGIDMIVIGTIMPLLPGITMTNGIRDIMEGNFISGTTKLVEALLVAFAIAGGVGFGMSFFI